MIGAAENLTELLVRSMSNWKTILVAGKEELGQVGIQRGIFQGDCWFPLYCHLPFTNVNCTEKM